MKFLCDQMLGTLAKWLRLFGFDTFYANAELDDRDLLEIAKNEGRVIITRDKQLIEMSKKEKLNFFKINSIDIDEQLFNVLQGLEIDEKNILSRCSICNSTIDKIKKSDVKDKVPERVFDNNEKFWCCSKCDKIYWTGTHYDKILTKINKIKKQS